MWPHPSWVDWLRPSTNLWEPRFSTESAFLCRMGVRFGAGTETRIQVGFITSPKKRAVLSLKQEFPPDVYIKKIGFITSTGLCLQRIDM